MFDNDILKDDLFGLVGMLQNDNPSFSQLVNSLVTPRKNRFLQEQHSLLQIEVIDQCSKNYSQWLYDTWEVATIYNLGDQVRYTDDGKSYEYINSTASAGNLPTDSNFWEEINELSNYLIKTQRQAIGNVLDYIDETRKIKGVTKTLLESIQLFDRANDYNNAIINEGKFVGIAIKLQDHRNLKVIVKDIGLQLSQTVADLTLYLYHTSQQQPIATAVIQQNRQMDFIWHDVSDNGFDLKYWGKNTDVGGVFYIGYYQTDLGTSQAYKKNYQWGIEPSGGGCCTEDYNLWQAWSEFTQVHPFEVNSQYIDEGGRTLFDISKTSWQYSNNYGLNLNFSVECDVTDFIAQNEKVLANAICKEWGLIVIRDIGNSFRDNKTEKQAVNLAMAALSEKNADNYLWKVEKAKKALEFDLSDLNEACSPCRDEWGPEWGAI